MNYSDPTKLGILACPGGEAFAESVARKLSSIYRRRFDRKSLVLGERYHISRELVTRKINFDFDISSELLYIPGDVNQYRSPRFRIDARLVDELRIFQAMKVLGDEQARSAFAGRQGPAEGVEAFQAGQVHEVCSYTSTTQRASQPSPSRAMEATRHDV